MKKLFILSAAFVCTLFAGKLSAQQITQQQTFTVSNYNIGSVGYPSRIVPIGDGNFAYMEFWMTDREHKYPNHYLQGYNGKFEEIWSEPITKEGAPKLDVIDIYKLKKSIAVVGHQYSASTKRIQTKVEFFSPKGRPVGGMVTMSTFDKKVKRKKGWEDYFEVSSDTTRILWMGHHPDIKYKKRKYYFSVFGGDGQKIWGKSLPVPHVMTDKYEVKHATVDNKGNMYLFLTYETFTNTSKDTLYKPYIVRYDYRENKFSEHQLDIPKAAIPEARIYINKKGELVVLAIVAQDVNTGFANGAKAFGTPINWNKILFRKFDIARELRMTKEQIIDIPNSWREKYGKEGANFSESAVMEKGDNLYWIMEEHYTQTHNNQLQHLYYDVGVVSIDMEKGEVNWANTFQKRQRDYQRGTMLSYVSGFAGGKLRFVYLNERGAQGKIVCTSMDLKDGSAETKPLASNQKADYLFFPRRSSMIGANTMMLMGVGNPVGNDYKLMRIDF